MATKPRSIFEEVGAAPKAAAAPGGIDARGKGARGAIRIWLMAIFVLVALIIAVGGMTRLTDSGLSITVWKPIAGMVPPLNDADWQAEFTAYQATPEYRLQNSAMQLAEFKYIFWWEWSHRQLGRIIGLAWAAGFVFFWATRRIPTGWTPRLLGVGVLIGLQGAVGWWMVSSGLQGTMLDVASYRLATHLGLAFVILGATAWFVLLLGRREADLMQARRAGEARLFGLGTGLLALTFAQILLGALVAGIDAGRAFPTWPLMGASFVPPDIFYVPDGGAVWRAFFENAGLVQFMHRMSGYVLFAFGLWVWLRARRSANDATRFAFHAVPAMLLVQMTLGILTAIHAAPLPLALAHQFGAVVLWVLVLRGRYLARYPLPQRIQGAKR
jgi:cytochrome c oxidase assembly protein subunit 15